MELDDRMMEEIASQLGIRQGHNRGNEIIRHLEKKTDEELEREILRIKHQLRANNITYEKQMNMLRNLMPMMNSKQRSRMQRVIELLK